MRVMEGDQALAEEVEKARRGKDILAELFPPATEPLEDPNSPEIQQFLDELMAKKDEPEEPDDAKVVSAADGRGLRRRGPCMPWRPRSPSA